MTCAGTMVWQACYSSELPVQWTLRVANQIRCIGTHPLFLKKDPQCLKLTYIFQTTNCLPLFTKSITNKQTGTWKIKKPLEIRERVDSWVNWQGFLYRYWELNCLAKKSLIQFKTTKNDNRMNRLCWGRVYYHGLTSIPTLISNYIHNKVWGEISYPFPNFNGALYPHLHTFNAPWYIH